MKTAALFSFAVLRATARALMLPAIGIMLAIMAWTWIGTRYGNPVLLPTPWQTLASLIDLTRDGSLLRDLVASLRRVGVGFSIAAGLAVPLALVLAFFKPLRRIVGPVLGVLRPIPAIAWIPLAILWLGIGDKPSYFITSVAAFFPIFISTLGGGLAVERQHLYAAQCLGAGRAALLFRIFLPSALPVIWTGLKIGLGQSWMAVVTAELIAAPSGLGYMMQINRINLETAHVLAGMAVVGLVGALMTAALDGCGRLIFPWKTTF